MRLIIDSHLDLSWNALSYNRDLKESVAQIRRREEGMTDIKGRGNATTSLPEMRTGRVAVCLATMLARAKREVQPVTGHRRTDLDFGTQEIAYGIARGQLAYYHALEEQGQMRMLRTAGDLDAHWRQWEAACSAHGDGDLNEAAPELPIGYISAMEGADPFVTPAQADSWWQAGLRVCGLSHYGKSHYSVGTGDAGPLTAMGVELLKAFDRLGMVLDTTHLSDPSFFGAMDVFAGPVLASHQNCRALVPGDRQFTDEQIKLIIQRDGVLGSALDDWMLYPGWIRGQGPRDQVSLATVADHMDHICQLAGNARHVAIGTDLDGGFGTEQSPCDLDTIADLQKLDAILASRGYSDADIDGVFHANWLRFFRRTLPK